MSEIPSTTSISAAAQAYQLAMAQQATPPTPRAPSESSNGDLNQDTIMNDAAATIEPAAVSHSELEDVNATDKSQLSAPMPSESIATPAPILPRTGTPARIATGSDAAPSRAASQLPEPTLIMPTEAPPHGAPARQYLNTKVTAALLEGMKQLAKEQPNDPLRVLGEFLLQRSEELEGK